MIERRRIQTQQQERLKEYAMILPHLGKLILRLVRDPRVPVKQKTTLGLVAAYIVSPIDLVPSRFVGGFGKFDDLIIAALALDQLVNQLPPEIVREHWDGDDDLLQTVSEILEVATSFVPERVKSLFARAFSTN